MSKKLAHDVALIATRLHDAGLTFADAELAAQYCLVSVLALGTEPGYLTRLLARPRATDLLWGGFIWHNTPQGQIYWFGLVRDLS